MYTERLYRDNLKIYDKTKKHLKQYLRNMSFYNNIVIIKIIIINWISLNYYYAISKKRIKLL